MSSRKQILIPVTIREDYTVTLKKRLEEYDIPNREICELTGMDETSFSRLFRASESTGKLPNPRIDTVTQIEQAILTIRSRHARQKRRQQK